MRRTLAAVLLFALAACQTAAPHPTPAPITLSSTLSIPVEIQQGRIHLPVSVNGNAPGSFVLDTGAAGSAIDETYARQIGIVPTGKSRALGAGGAVDVPLATDVPLRFGTIDHTVPRLPMIPLAPVSARAGHRMDGVLGHDVLRSLVVEVDYERKTAAFHDPAAYTPPAGAVRLPIRFHGRLPTVDARVTLPDGRTLTANMLIDTGAGGGFRFSGPFVQKQKIELANAIDTTLGFGVGGASNDRVGRVTRAEVAGFTFENPLAVLTLGNKGALAEEKLDGLIGAEILRRFTLVIDYPHQQFLLVPNSRLSAPFDFDASGAILGAREAGSPTLVIHTILPNSPAAEAGVRVGDELRAIDGRAVTAAEIDDVRKTLKQVGKRMELTLVREGREMKVEVMTRKLL